MSGGSYQYLATADHILRYLRNNLGELASIALHVRPTSLAERGVAADDDIVDYVDGVVVDKIQVKASSDPPNNQLVRDLYPGIIADGDALDNFNKQPRDLHKRERSASAPGQTPRETPASSPGRSDTRSCSRDADCAGSNAERRLGTASTFIGPNHEDLS